MFAIQSVDKRDVDARCACDRFALSRGDSKILLCRRRLFKAVAIRAKDHEQAYRDWPAMLNNDSVLASAVLDRLLHRSETVLIKGKSYRMKDRVD